MTHEIQLEQCNDDIKNKLTCLFDEHKNNDQVNVTNDHVIEIPSKKKSLKKCLNLLKICLLVGIWITFTVIFMLTDEKEIFTNYHCIARNSGSFHHLSPKPNGPRISVIVEGDFTFDSNDTDNLYLLVYLQSVVDNSSIESISNTWRLQIESSEIYQKIALKHVFKLNRPHNQSTIQIVFENPIEKVFPVQITYDPHPIDTHLGLIYGILLLIGLYTLIIWEIIHRTFAAILASTMSIAFLALLGDRPEMSEIMSWIDIETLLLLFGMMTLVAILSDTGIFDFMAVYAYRITKGEVWPLIICLAIFTSIMSAFLDNATTLLLMGPVIIRLCEVMELNPIPVLIMMIAFSNIGGALTPVGDPPNIIIVSNGDVIKSGIDFPTFVLHMSIGVILVSFQTYLQFRYVKFRRIETLRNGDSIEIKQIRRDIKIWEKVKTTITTQTIVDENETRMIGEEVAGKLNQLSEILKEKINVGSISPETFQSTLADLEQKYPIRNKVLLVQSSFCLIFVLSLFFLHSLPQLQRLSLGWTALIGALLLLILLDSKDIDSILMKVEWSTLLFFAGLFIIIEALTKMGLIDLIGEHTKNVILSAPIQYRLAVAIIIILWVSAIASAFFDNIPITTMMIKIVITLSQNRELGLSLQPLIWALSFGACLGGNGTMIGASANVICAGVAEKYGYKLTFMEFLKIGFPLMVVNVTMATGYLLIAHILFEWH